MFFQFITNKKNQKKKNAFDICDSLLKAKLGKKLFVESLLNFNLLSKHPPPLKKNILLALEVLISEALEIILDIGFLNLRLRRLGCQRITHYIFLKICYAIY